ncbi:hypothetical protein RJT34_29356 [Clitoria ternatea]|uniref:Uncharacterized protein n=1 Tax=Clitoria ternatea TaxID=43366 RepID=A0AAN9ID40_CLITE
MESLESSHNFSADALFGSHVCMTRGTQLSFIRVTRGAHPNPNSICSKLQFLFFLSFFCILQQLPSASP